jgi:L-2,4-diaminobutyrate decarboxylase
MSQDKHLIDRVRELFPHDTEEDQDLSALIARTFERLNARTKGTMIGGREAADYAQIVRSAQFPESMQDLEQVLAELVSLYDGTINRIHPLTQENVLPPPTKLSIVAGALAEKYNENSIWDFYGPGAAIAEVKAAAMMADLIGYDKTKSGGIFTFGGTGCNLYGARIGIEKADPNAKETGIRDRIVFFCSDTAHYSIRSCAIWTGVGTDNLVVVPTDDNNSMIPGELEAAIRGELAKGHRIGTLFCTMGTTDAFGIDPISQVIAIRNTIEKEVGYRIHVHADAVIGWPYLTFKGDRRTLEQLSPRLSAEISRIIDAVATIKDADSVGIDFHKTGWSPYLCSLLLVKDQADLWLLRKSKKDMPYLYHGTGYQPGCFTLESSRPNYAAKALVNILSLGREGYEAILVQLLSCADYLRDLLERSADMVVLNRNNPAFVTDFRVYPPTVLQDMEQRGMGKNAMLKAEFNDEIAPESIEAINLYNRAIVEAVMARAYATGSSLLSYTDLYRTSRQGQAILAIKSYPMSPMVETAHMERLLTDVGMAKAEVDKV